MATRTGARSRLGVQVAGRFAGRASAGASRAVWPDARPACKPAAIACLVERLGQVDPGRLGQADQRRRREADPFRGQCERRPGSIQRDLVRRVEDEAAVHPAEHRRVVLRRTGSRCRPGRAPRADRPPTGSPPDRAGRSAHRGPARSSPSPRCSRWRPAAARRPTARTARGRRGGRSPGARGSRRSARPSRLAGRRGSRARTRAPRGPTASTPTAGWPVSRRRSRPGRAARPRPPSRCLGPRSRRCRRASPGRRVG